MRIRGPGCLLLLLACGAPGDRFSVKGSSKGLDSLGYVADSLFAQAERPVQALVPPPAVVVKDSSTGSSAAGAPTPTRANTGASATTTPARPAPDTIRGVVVLTGSPPVQQPMLRTPGGDLIALSGMASGGIARLEGLELSVKGMMITSRDVVVSDFLVRAKGALQVLDGRLAENGGVWTVQLTDGSGTRRLTSPPAFLRDLLGSRVWVGVNAAGVPLSFGEVARR